MSTLLLTSLLSSMKTHRLCSSPALGTKVIPREYTEAQLEDIAALREVSGCSLLLSGS